MMKLKAIKPKPNLYKHHLKRKIRKFKNLPNKSIPSNLRNRQLAIQMRQKNQIQKKSSYRWKI